MEICRFHGIFTVATTKRRRKNSYQSPSVWRNWNFLPPIPKNPASHYLECSSSTFPIIGWHCDSRRNKNRCDRNGARANICASVRQHLNSILKPAHLDVCPWYLSITMRNLIDFLWWIIDKFYLFYAQCVHCTEDDHRVYRWRDTHQRLSLECNKWQ